MEIEIETKHIIIVLALILLVYLFTSKNENYDPGFCGHCSSLTKDECANCPNCGICTDDTGCETCQQGDESGPYFNIKCIDWKYKGKTPSGQCWNYDSLSPYNCGRYESYHKMATDHIKWADRQPMI